MFENFLFRSLAAIAVLMLLMGTAGAVEIETVPIGNAGNADDTTGYGGVDYPYNIGKYEVTAGQYTEFLNAVAATDPYWLYNRYMWSSSYGCKIERSGALGSYTYSVAADRAQRPVNFVSFWDAARFANWLHNGQGNGDTESGAYVNIGNQATFARQPGATWVIPTEDEWYKAAYHKNNGATGDYWDYPTSSDGVPSNDLVNPDPGNNANFCTAPGNYSIGSPYYTTVVGEFENSESPYGTFDQGGNLWEWNETAIGSSRSVRGGCWASFFDRGDVHPSGTSSNFGFRVASIPEPGSITLLVCGLLAGLVWWRRRK